MRKVEASTLEEAYEKASQMLECSISELQSEVMQYPSKGILGFFKKNAIIIATCNNSVSNKAENEVKKESVSDDKFDMTPPEGYEKTDKLMGM